MDKGSLSRQLLPANRNPGTFAGHPLYSPTEVVGSSEMLLVPSMARFGAQPYHDFQTEPSLDMSSRRTSWDSGRTRGSRHGQFASPPSVSRAPSRARTDEDVNTQTVLQKYNIMPSEGLLVLPEDVEKDDYLHNPDPKELGRNGCNVFSKRGLMNIGGLVFITLGILALFVAYPAVTFAQEKLDSEDMKGCSANVDC